MDNKHRRLTWIYSLGSCMVKGNFDAKPIEMTMSTLQAAICLLFNDAAELSYAEIRVRRRPRTRVPRTHTASRLARGAACAHGAVSRRAAPVWRARRRAACIS